MLGQTTRDTIPHTHTSLTSSKPMTDARLRSDCLGLNRHKLLRGVSPLRNGESGGSRLSNNSGFRWSPKETRFFFNCGFGRSAASSPLLRFLEVSFTKTGENIC